MDAVHESRLDAAGEAAAAATIHWLLTTRLAFFEDRKRHPIAEEKVVRPVFATGEPRSGTTLLHALLAEDPAARALRFWEVMYPSPPPGLSSPTIRVGPGPMRTGATSSSGSRRGSSAIRTTICSAMGSPSASGPGRSTSGA